MTLTQIQVMKNKYFITLYIMYAKQYPKTYRIVLNSADAVYRDGEFSFPVNLPLFDNLHTKVGWMLGVESFFTNSTIAGISLNGGGTFANLHLRELSQIGSYSSSRRNCTDVILTFNSGNVANSFVSNSVASPITDEGFFVNKNLTFYFSDRFLNKSNLPFDTDFQLVLTIWRNSK
jgi:hypothetical protein